MKKDHLFGIVSAILFLLMIGCESMNYNRAVQENTINSYNEFLSKYENSKYNRDVHRRKEKLIWNNAQKENSFQNYQNYMDSYPNGAFVENALIGAKNAATKLKGTDLLNAQSFIEFNEIKKNPNEYVNIEIIKYKLNNDTIDVESKGIIDAIGSSGVQDVVEPVFYTKVTSRAKFCIIELMVKVLLTQEGTYDYSAPLIAMGGYTKKIKAVHEASSPFITIEPQSSTNTVVHLEKFRASAAASSWGSRVEIKTKFTNIETIPEEIRVYKKNDEKNVYEKNDARNVFVDNGSDYIFIEQDGKKISFTIEFVNDFNNNLKGKWPNVDFASFDIDFNGNQKLDKNVDKKFGGLDEDRICDQFLLDHRSQTVCRATKSKGSYSGRYISTQKQKKPHPVFEWKVPVSELSNSNTVNVVFEVYRAESKRRINYPKQTKAGSFNSIQFNIK